MRRSPANSTNRSLAAFGKLQHIRVGSSPSTTNARNPFAGRMRIQVGALHNSRNDRYSPLVLCDAALVAQAGVDLSRPDTVRAVASELEALASSALKLSWAGKPDRTRRRIKASCADS